MTGSAHGGAEARPSCGKPYPANFGPAGIPLSYFVCPGSPGHRGLCGPVAEGSLALEGLLARLNPPTEEAPHVAR